MTMILRLGVVLSLAPTRVLASPNLHVTKDFGALSPAIKVRARLSEARVTPRDLLARQSCGTGRKDCSSLRYPFPPEKYLIDYYSQPTAVPSIRAAARTHARLSEVNAVRMVEVAPAVIDAVVLDAWIYLRHAVGMEVRLPTDGLSVQWLTVDQRLTVQSPSGVVRWKMESGCVRDLAVLTMQVSFRLLSGGHLVAWLQLELDLLDCCNNP
ncbi:hypothetical protein BJY04DRAFT_187910 [Aspergillus karnatakaensis]|uniref:uncharacterized protein n=1 Tax=Aspergillus karnatakaensis TaxID=1810916 RepID=UPI003CCDB826